VTSFLRLGYLKCTVRLQCFQPTRLVHHHSGRPALRRPSSRCSRSAGSLKGSIFRTSPIVKSGRARSISAAQDILRARRPTPPEALLIGRPAHGAPLTSINSPVAHRRNNHLAPAAIAQFLLPRRGRSNQFKLTVREPPFTVTLSTR